MFRLRRIVHRLDRGTGPERGRSTGGARVGQVVAHATKEQIRGSSILLSGRGIALGIKFITQLVIVRYLTTADYGAWAYALAAVALMGSFSSLSLDRGVTRFAAIYHEEKQHQRFFGTLLLVAGVIVLTGAVFAGSLYAFPDFFAKFMGQDAMPLTLLFVLILLVPLEGLDQLLIAIFATLGRTGAIFFRKYLLGPTLQLTAVLLLVGLNGDVQFLARAYVSAMLIGVIVNVALLVRMLAEDGLLPHFRLRTLRLPTKALFAFSLPLLSSDVHYVLVESFGILLLGYAVGSTEVALLRAIVPLALLCQVASQSFQVLFLPIASRLFSAGNHEALGDLYWRSSLWVAVLSFPVFAAIFTAASPLAVLLYGARYEPSGPLLTMLAFGVYVRTSLGVSGAMLKVFGRVRALVTTNAISGGANILLCFTLIPLFGATGTAVAMTVTMIFEGVLKNAAVNRATGLNLFAHENVRPWGVIGSVVLALTAIRVFAPGNIILLGGAACAGVVVVLLATRQMLEIEAVFPELSRFPLLRWIVR